MPTGYTAIIEERGDLTFREFALRCARGMGACIMQREDPLDEPPKAPAPSDYYEQEKRKAEGKLLELRAMTPESARPLWQESCDRIAKFNAESVARAKELEARYARMRALAEAWTPPTKDHEGLRRFMIEQIDMCKSDWTAYTMTPSPTPAEWLAEQLRSAERDLTYATEHAAGEIERARERGAWIDALYASLSEGAAQ